MRRETFATATPPALEIRNAAGAVEVETIDSDETVVVLEPLRGEGSRRAVEDAVVEQHGDRIVVDIEGRSFFGVTISVNRDVRVAITTPHGAAVDAKTASADVGIRGRVRNIDVQTASGDVAVGDVDGDARVKTANGDVAVDAIAGGAELQSASGDLGVHSLGGDARVRTASGDVRVGEAAASLTVQTASGDVRLDSVRAGRVDVKTASGDIWVGIRRGSRAWLDARSLSGDAESQLAVGDALEDEDGPLVELTALSMSGDVQIARAPEHIER